MSKDYRTWWRDWKNQGKILPGMITLVPSFSKKFGWSVILNQIGFDTSEIDCLLEQWWAILRNLA